MLRTGCTTKEVKQLVSGVEVKLSDGTAETGDTVLGCDGVNSLVRSLMWDHANKTTKGLITAKEKTYKFATSEYQSFSRLVSYALG